MDVLCDSPLVRTNTVFLSYKGDATAPPAPHVQDSQYQ